MSTLIRCNKSTGLYSFLLCLVTMIQEQESVEDGTGCDKGSNVAGLAGIQAIMQSISSLNGKIHHKIINL